MPINATLLVSVNGGAPTTGGITAAVGDELQFSFQSTVGWGSARLELSAPPGLPTPAGWTAETVDGHTRFYVVGRTPPPPVTASLWGKYMPRLVVNGGAAVDEATAISIPSENGLLDMGHREAGQFGGSAEKWAKDHRTNLRILDDFVAGGGGGGGGGSVPSVASTTVKRGTSGEVNVGANTAHPTVGDLRHPVNGSAYAITGGGDDARIYEHTGSSLIFGDTNTPTVIRTQTGGNVSIADGTFRLLLSGTCSQPGDIRRDGTTGQLYTYKQGVGEVALATGAAYWEKDFGVTTALTGGVRYLHPGVGTSSTAISVMRAHVACTITSMNIVVGIAGTGTSTWTFTLVKATPAGSTYTPVATSMTTSFLVTELGASVTGSVSLAAGEYFAIQYIASSGTSASPQSLVGTLRFEGV